MMWALTFCLVVLALALPQSLSAQVVKWDKVFGGTGHDLLNDMRLTADGGFILAGTSASPVGPGKAAAYGDYDYWVVKCDANANVQWERTYGGDNNDNLIAALPLRAGGYLLAGTSLSGMTGNKTVASFGAYDIWLIRLDNDGNRLWERAYGGSGWDEFGGKDAIIQTSDGGFLVGGDSSSNPSGNKNSPYYGGASDVWVLKLNASGDKEWEQTFGGPGYDIANFVHETSDSYFVAGLAGPGDYYAWSARLDKTTGRALTQNSYGAPVVMNSGLALPDGGYWLVGYTLVANPNGWLTRVDALGNFVANRTIGGAGMDADRLHSLAALHEGGFLAGGESYSPPGGDRTAVAYGDDDYWLVKFDDQGGIVWDKSFGGTGYEYLSKVLQTPDGGILLAGYSDSAANPAGGKSQGSLGGVDYWIVKLGPPGDTIPPTINCPANLSAGCSVERFAAVSYPAPTASDDSRVPPTVTCTPASGSASFAVGVNTVVCTAVDAAGNSSQCSFTVTRAALGFTGFASPIGGEVANGTGGSFAHPVRAFKLGSKIPVKFQASCGGSPVVTGAHTLQLIKFSNATDSDPAIDATPAGAATTGNQFRLTEATTGTWSFTLDTNLLSVGTWKMVATLSDGSIHEVWITTK